MYKINENSTRSYTLSESMVQDGKGVVFHSILALIIFLVDSFIFQQGIVSFLLAVWYGLQGIISIIFALFKGRSLSKGRLFKSILYLIIFFMVVTIILGNNRMAKRNAEKIIMAIKQYKEKYHHYPEHLEQLIPGFISDIPPAKYALLNTHFIYKNQKEFTRLEYVFYPPYGRHIFYFQKNKWSSLD